MPIQLDEEKRRRKRVEKYIVVSLIILIAAISSIVLHLSGISSQLPYANSIFFFGLINLNLILIILLFYFVTRNIVKLVLARRRKMLGAKLKTKLVTAFVAFSLIPTILMFAIAAIYINNNFKKWFSSRIDQALHGAMAVAHNYYEQTRENGFHFAEQIRDFISRERLLRKDKTAYLKKTLREALLEYDADRFQIYFVPSLILHSEYQKPGLLHAEFPALGNESIKLSLQSGRSSEIHSLKNGDLIRCIVPIYESSKMEKIEGILVLEYLLPEKIVEKMEAVVSTYEDYKDVNPLKIPLESIYLFILVMITLLILLSATWVGFYLAKQLTIPIEELARGTNEVASGHLQYRIKLIGSDELGTLVSSFNKMTQDLEEMNSSLEKANADLKKSNAEIEEKRRYMEALLQHVTAGVVSIDPQGRVRMMNDSARELFNLKLDAVLGRNYRELLPGIYVTEIDQMTKELLSSYRRTIKRQIEGFIAGKHLTLLISATTVQDPEFNPIGIVAVIDDLSELLRAQRVAAWQEVARRIAHEIKNPLTPIRLSAQRLKNRLIHKLSPNESQLAEECIDTIMKQVEELKELVNEFSLFARMPEAVPVPEQIENVIYEALILFKEAHKHIYFRHIQKNDIPVMDIDREQIKRVLINLLDNAVAAIEDEGNIEIASSYNSSLQMVTLEVCDDGPGISRGIRSRLFEPYFSTKKSGTGLGLAIVQRIISDHDGFVRVSDNKPRGTRVIIELPLRQKKAHQNIPLHVEWKDKRNVYGEEDNPRCG